MVQPVNYMALLPQVDIAGGFAGLGQALQQREQRIQAQDMQKQYAQDLQVAYQSGDPQAFAMLAVKYPSQAQGLKTAFSTMNEAQRENELLTGAKVYNAIRSGSPQTATAIVDQQIEALRNSGKPTQRMEAIRDALNADPTAVTKNLDMVMYAVAGDRWGKMTGVGEKQVQSSDILPDGTTVTIFKDGSRQVTDAQGNLVTGEAAAGAVQQAQRFGAGVKSEEKSRSFGLEQAQKIAEKSFEQLPKIEGNIANLDEAIRLVQAGAQTGIIESKVPTWNASTIALRNVKNRLGLDIISSVTFGALSEGELSLAMETALPTNLEGQDLIDWINRKKQAQTKLLGYLNKQAEFLSSGDKTLNDWMKFQKDEKKRLEDSIPKELKGKSYLKAITGN